MAEWKQSSSKEASRLKQTVENIFGLSGSRSATLTDEDNSEGSIEMSRFFTEDVLKMIGCEVPRSQRLRALKELHELVLTKRLEKHAVEAIWSTIEDLIDPHQPVEVRHAAFKFLSALIQGQYDYLGILQGHFFQVVKMHRIGEDLFDRLNILQVLTQGGKNVQYIDEDIGSMMAEWMPLVMESKRIELRKLFMTILVALVHFNAVYLETHHVQQLVQTCGKYLASNADPEMIELILDFLNSLVCFGCLSTSILEPFVTSLCWTLNVERFCTTSWDVMRKLLGTHLGHNTLISLQVIIRERKTSLSEVMVIRGAVFYISMALWGPAKVSKLGNCFSPFLPSLKEAALSHQTIVVYEVSLSLQRLTKKYGADLGPAEWEEIINILSVIDRHIQKEPSVQVGSTLSNSVEEIFTTIETLHENGHIVGMDSRFYSLVEQSYHARTIGSILSLVRYKSKEISPDEPHWITKFLQFLDQFYKVERRTEVRLQALEVLKSKLDRYLVFYEDMLFHDIIAPVLSSVSSDPDPSVRKVAVEILVQVAETCSPTHCSQIVNYINQVTSHCITADKVASNHKGYQHSGEDPKRQDSKFALFGLANLFKMKLGHLPPGIAVSIFDMLVNHLIDHYNSGYHSDKSSLDHLAIFGVILHLHANEDGHIGFGDGEKNIDYSPFVLCQPRTNTQSSSSITNKRKMSDTRKWGPAEPVVLGYLQAYRALLLCLQKEPQWEVLQSVLVDLPQWLRSRNLLILSDISLDSLCCNLCTMLSNPGVVLQHVHNKPRGSFIDELRSLIFPILSVICPHAEHLERQSQEKLVYTFQQGLISEQAKLCVTSLTVCMLEIQQTMGRLMATILMKLSQATASPLMAVPVLEFLHGLCSLTHLCKGFVENQYLLVFGILVPYTDASKYSKFVVCLAYRVISLWFIRSRMQCRRSIAQFVIKKLMDNGALFNQQPFAPPTSSEGHTPSDEVDNDKLFHFEMVQVCIDLLARYTYSTVSSQPKRSPLSEFLISDGPSKTWLVKNFLITVTTSGASGSERICQRCALVKTGLLGGKVLTDSTLMEKDGHPLLCSCWNRGWAEVKIRRPTGSVSWLMRVQNQLDLLSSLDPLLTSHLTRDIGIAEINHTDLVSESSSMPSTTILSRRSSESSSPEEDCRGSADVDDPGHTLGSILDEEEPELLEVVDSEVDSSETSSRKKSTAEEDSVQKSDPISISVRFERIQHTTSNSSELCEFLPPLLSYEGNTRSPSLHSGSTLLNEQQQLNLMATMSEGTLSHSESIPQESEGSEDDNLRVERLSVDSDEDCLVQLHTGDAYPQSTDERCTVDRDEDDGQGDGQPTVMPSSDRHLGMVKEDTQPVLKPAGTRQEYKFVRNNESGANNPQGAKFGLHHHIESELRNVTETSQPSGSGHSVQDRELLNNPSFVFLELYYSSAFGDIGEAPPILLPNDEAAERAIKVLDHIPPYEVHKIGVIYVAQDQTTEQTILGNTVGSSRYMAFLNSLGTSVHLHDCNPDLIYLGGLDKNGADGETAILWHEEITQIVFHVATLMPNSTNDGNHSNKKLHIGNDNVVIVYNNSNSPYSFGTIKGQYNFYEVIVDPLPYQYNKVYIQAKSGYEDKIDCHPMIISDKWLSLYVRLLSLHANMACIAARSTASNWLERLHQIKRMKTKYSTQSSSPSKPNVLTDFTAFTL